MKTLIFYRIASFYGLLTLTRVNGLESHDFASFTKLASKVTVGDLQSLNDTGDIFHTNHNFLVLVHSTFESKKIESIALKIKSGFDCLLSKKDINTFKSSFDIRPDTSENDIKNIILNVFTHFKIHGNKTPLLYNKIISSLFDDFSITIATSEQIKLSYSKFPSCMDKYSEQMPFFYNTVYNNENKISIGVLILWHKNVMTGRAVFRVQSNKIASFYGYNRVIFTALTKKLGYKIDCDALIGARLPIVLDDNGALLVPYIDSSNKEISLKIDNDHGNYLVIATKKDDLILLGRADGQNLQLQHRTSEYDDYFSDDYCSHNICSNCSDDVEEDEYNVTSNGDILCQNCAGYCDQCGETVVADEMVVGLSEQRGAYYRIYACNCCAENAETMVVF